MRRAKLSSPSSDPILQGPIPFNVISILRDSREEWDNHVDALQSLTKYVVNVTNQQSLSNSDLSALLSQLRILAPSFALLISDLRSSLVRAVCDALHTLANTLGPAFVAQVDIPVVPALLKRACTSKAIIRDSANRAATALFEHGISAISPATANHLTAVVQDRKTNSAMRLSATQFIGLFLERPPSADESSPTSSPSATPSSSSISPAAAQAVEAAILAGVSDPDEAVRAQSRRNWIQLAHMDETAAASLLQRVAPHVAPLLLSAFDDEFGRSIDLSSKSTRMPTEHHITLAERERFLAFPPEPQRAPAAPSGAALADGSFGSGSIGGQGFLRHALNMQPLRAVPNPRAQDNPEPIVRKPSKPLLRPPRRSMAPGVVVNMPTVESISTKQAVAPLRSHIPTFQSKPMTACAATTTMTAPVRTMAISSGAVVRERSEGDENSVDDVVSPPPVRSETVNSGGTNTNDGSSHATSRKDICALKGSKDTAGSKKLHDSEDVSSLDDCPQTNSGKVALTHITEDSVVTDESSSSAQRRIGTEDSYVMEASSAEQPVITGSDSTTAVVTPQTASDENVCGGSKGRLSYILGTNITPVTTLRNTWTRASVDPSSPELSVSSESKGSNRLSGSEVGLGVALEESQPAERNVKTGTKRGIVAPNLDTDVEATPRAANVRRSYEVDTSSASREVTALTRMENRNVKEEDVPLTVDIEGTVYDETNIPTAREEECRISNGGDIEATQPSNFDENEDVSSRKVIWASNGPPESVTSAAKDATPHSTLPRKSTIGNLTGRKLPVVKPESQLVGSKPTNENPIRTNTIAKDRSTTRAMRLRRATTAIGAVSGPRANSGTSGAASVIRRPPRRSVMPPQEPPASSLTSRDAQKSTKVDSKRARANVMDTKGNNSAPKTVRATVTAKPSAFARLAAGQSARAGKKAVRSSSVHNVRVSVAPTSGDGTGRGNGEAGGSNSKPPTVSSAIGGGGKQGKAVVTLRRGATLAGRPPLPRIGSSGMSGRKNMTAASKSTTKTQPQSATAGRGEGSDAEGKPKPEVEPLDQLRFALSDLRAVTGRGRGDWSLRLNRMKDVKEALQALERTELKANIVEEAVLTVGDSTNDGHHRVVVAALDALFLLLLRIEGDDGSKSLQKVLEKKPEVLKRVLHLCRDSKEDLRLAGQRVLQGFEVQFEAEVQVGLVLRAMGFEPARNAGGSGTGKSSRPGGLRTGVQGRGLTLTATDARVTEVGCKAIVKALERAESCEGGFVWKLQMLETVFVGMGSLRRDKRVEVRRGADRVIEAVRKGLPPKVFDMACRDYGVKFAGATSGVGASSAVKTEEK